jgi:membrane associated rhomboid family serine protease
MTPAAVGFQCPECVSAGKVGTRSTRTVLGGRFSRDGAVTMSLIGICVGAFLVVSTFGGLGGMSRWGMQPVAIALGGQWGRLFTSIFMHAGWLHLAFNMYVLFLLGPPLERILGHVRFLLVFLLSGLGGAVASYTFSPIATLSVGASGAIFGLMTAMIVVGRKLGYDVGQVVALFAINIVLGFMVGGIDWRAHLGGAAVGALSAYVLSRHAPGAGKPNIVNQGLATFGIVVGLVAIIIWRTAELRSLAGIG